MRSEELSPFNSQIRPSCQKIWSQSRVTQLWVNLFVAKVNVALHLRYIQLVLQPSSPEFLPEARKCVDQITCGYGAQRSGIGHNAQRVLFHTINLVTSRPKIWNHTLDKIIIGESIAPYARSNWIILNGCCNVTLVAIWYHYKSTIICANTVMTDIWAVLTNFTICTQSLLKPCHRWRLSILLNVFNPSRVSSNNRLSSMHDHPIPHPTRPSAGWSHPPRFSYMRARYAPTNPHENTSSSTLILGRKVTGRRR